ncbi:MAG: AraC family transcriptional regulator [Pseudonocardiales bacterium]|nr:MAG: AraC family transcriptional regulator [Pseudonocardiales bacterium]
MRAELTADFDHCYRAVSSRDARFDGRFYTAVTSTGIYCRPSCPAQIPRRENVRFYRHAAAAAAAGFRACRRCRPDTAPGSREWDARGDLAARALRLVADGTVDAEGVGGLARRLAVSERHLHRILVAEVGAGPLALARTRRAQTARLLIEATSLPLTDVCFTAGFASVRQFNDTMLAEFGCPPGDLRRHPPAPVDGVAGGLVLRLPYRRPYDDAAVLAWLRTRAVAGVEEVTGAAYRRVVTNGTSRVVVTLEPADGHVVLRCRIDDVRDLAGLVQRCRRLFDLDADPDSVGAVLSADPALAPLVAARPGLRVPGSVDGFELATRAILGQQVSVAGARTLAGRLVSRLAAALPTPDGALTHAFPTAAAVAGADLAGLGLTGARARALTALAEAVAGGQLDLGPGADRAETRQRLLALPGVGPWTVEYVVMRALTDPDAFPDTDLVLRHAMTRHGITETDRWRPWRAYAAMYLWTDQGADSR